MTILFRLAVKPAKGGKKGKKGKTPEPEAEPEPVADEEIAKKDIFLNASGKTQSVHCGGGPLTETYEPPVRVYARNYQIFWLDFIILK